MSVTLSRKKRRMDTTGDFNLVVVGCGGGHDETNLSGYLFKPKNKSWSDGVLGLEAGSGYGALKRLLGTTHPRLFSPLFSSPRPTGKALSQKTLPLSPIDKAYTVYSHLRAYLLTHAHLDHAASLVISSGSLPGPTKYILGARGVLEDLEHCIWGPGRCWPGIVGWENHLHSSNRSESGSESSANTSGGILRALPVASPPPNEPTGDRDEEYTPVGLGLDDVLVRVVPVSHGCGPKGYLPHPPHSPKEDVYKSSAFFIRHAQSRHEFLFFGDVEADPLSPALPSSRPLLRPIWQHAAHLFASRRLHTLLIECSYPAGRPETQLFGHLSVEGLRREMQALAQEALKLREKDQRVLKEVVESSNNQASQLTQAQLGAPRRSGRVKPVHSDLYRTTKGAKRKAPSELTLESTPESTRPVDPLEGILKGLRVIVIHCKDPAPGFDLAGAPTIADFIARQLKEGVEQDGVDLGPDVLGAEYIAAHQGDEFVV